MRNAAFGQGRRAMPMAMAECTPKTRASYDAVATTPRGPRPPTITALPLRLGLAACSTAA